MNKEAGEMVTQRKSPVKRILTPGRVIIGALLLLAAPLIFYSMQRSVDQPTAQLTVNMPGTGQEFVNIWLEPDPPKATGVNVIAQIADIGGTPGMANSMEFRVGRGDGSPVSVQAGEAIVMYEMNMAKRGRFSALLQFPEPGDWWIDVVVTMGGQQGVVRLPVKVVR